MYENSEENKNGQRKKTTTTHNSNSIREAVRQKRFHFTHNTKMKAERRKKNTPN